MRCTESMVCQWPRVCRTETTSLLYSAASSAVRPVGADSSTGVASTHSAAPAPGTPVPIRTRPGARPGAAGPDPERAGGAGDGARRAGGQPADLVEGRHHARGAVDAVEPGDD